MTERRFGEFSISWHLVNHRHDIARAILKDVIVVSAFNDGDDCVYYTGVHPDFEVVPIGTTIPFYRAEVTLHTEGLRTQWELSLGRRRSGT